MIKLNTVPYKTMVEVAKSHYKAVIGAGQTGEVQGRL